MLALRKAYSPLAHAAVNQVQRRRLQLTIRTTSHKNLASIIVFPLSTLSQRCKPTRSLRGSWKTVQYPGLLEQSSNQTIAVRSKVCTQWIGSICIVANRISHILRCRVKRASTNLHTSSPPESALPARGARAMTLPALIGPSFTMRLPNLKIRIIGKPFKQFKLNSTFRASCF